MQAEVIAEGGIDQAGNVFVRPANCDFEHVYRAGMAIYWDRSTRALSSLAPAGSSPAQWFRQIIEAVASEYGVRLHLTDRTVWSNLPADVRAEIEASR